MIPLLLIIAFIGRTEPLAQQYAGIPSDRMNYFYSEQRRTQWCWAAAIQMVMNYYGVAISQETIVRRSYGSDPFGNLPDWAGSLPIITANLNNWGIDDRGRRYMVTASFGLGAPAPALLLNELSQGHPVIIGYATSFSGGHAVVCTAANYTNSIYGPIINTIVVRDPWPSPENRLNGGRVEYPGLQLASRITGYWIIRVAKEDASSAYLADDDHDDESDDEETDITFEIQIRPFAPGRYGAEVEVAIDDEDVGQISNMDGPYSLDVDSFPAGSHTYNCTADIYSFDAYGNPHYVTTLQGSGKIYVKDGEVYRVEERSGRVVLVKVR